MRSAQINNVAVAIHGDMTGGRPVIIAIHGAGGGAWLWEGLRRELAGRVDLIAIDLPGHGTSAGNGAVHISEYRDVVRETSRATGLTKPYAMGHSMGGAISIDWALSYPGELSGVISISSGARLRVHPMVFEALEGDMANYIAMMDKVAFGPEAKPEILEKARASLALVDPEITAGDFRACNEYDAMEAVRDIRLPTLALCGAEDKLTPPKYSRYLADLIPSASVEIISGAGHMLPVEKPAECAASIKQFIGKTD